MKHQRRVTGLPVVTAGVEEKIVEAGALSHLYTQARDQFSFSQSIRRDLHLHPELGFNEIRTAGIIANELNRLGYEVSTGIGKTGVVATLESDTPGPVILARFDMDALPVQEETGAEYASTVPGKMHACGHDGHVAVGLTVARLLQQNRSALKGTVKLIFQPAEEGLGGAEAMIKDGVLTNPAPEATLSLHLWNDLPLGWAAIHAGPLMAGGDIFEIKIAGRGGHGALPHQTVDPVLAAAQVTTALQSIVSRNVSPLQAAIVSVTQIHAGEAFNVIPPFATLNGTIRTYEPEVRARVIERFEQIVKLTSEAMGCHAEVNVQQLTPAVISDPKVAEVVAKAAEAALPDLKNDSTYRTTVSEDMAFIMQEVPGCYFLVGSAKPEKGLVYGHHHPKFDIDEEALVIGSTLMTAALISLLNR